MEGNPNPTNVAHNWYFYDDRQKYIDFIDKVMPINKSNLIIAPSENYEDGIMLWWKWPSQSFMYLIQVRILERSFWNG